MQHRHILHTHTVGAGKECDKSGEKGQCTLTLEATESQPKNLFVNSSHYGVGTYYILIENNYYYSHISNKHINISFNDNTNYSNNFKYAI